MELSYWQARWHNDKTGWHMQQVYPHLKTYWQRLQLEEGDTVLVPLCGKSLDLKWLAEQKYNVIGIEVSEKAVHHFFQEHQMPFQKSYTASVTVYRSENLTIWAGNFFKLKPANFPEIDAIYDKAALIALPKKQRKQYAGRILAFCNPETQMLLNTFEYEQSEMNGPPFAVLRKELEQLYGHRFAINLLHEDAIFDKLIKFQQRGLSSYLLEKVYHLAPLNQS